MRTWALACERMHARVTHNGAGVGAGLADLFPLGRNPAHFFAGVSRPPETTSLRVRVPTLVIWGMRDEALLPGSLEGLESYVQDLKIVRIADAGHLPMRTHGHAVNLVIRDFLQRPG